MKPLLPALTAAQLYPDKSVYMARTHLPEVAMLGYTDLQLDSATSMLMGLLNGYATVRHAAGCGDEVLGLFASAGIEVREQIHSFTTEAQAIDCAQSLIRDGHKLFWPYPLPANLYPESAQLVATDLYRRLNAKQNMSAWIPPEYLVPQQHLSQEALAHFRSAQPVCLKAGGDAPTGWGYAVFPCRDQQELDAARSWFGQRRDSVPVVLAEQWLDISCSWCVGLAIGATGTSCFGGAEQLFSTPCKQKGSIIDPGRAMPPAVESLAILIGEKARKMGFRGIAGLDIGLERSGKVVVFDPNFRIASSTAQLLFHPAASGRAGLPVSLSVQLNPAGRFSDVERKLRGPIEDGWFVPTRFFNGEKHPLACGLHIITGFVLGADRNRASKSVESLRELL